MIPRFRQVQYVILGLCVALAPLVLFLSFVFDPTGGVPPAFSATIADFQSASPLNNELNLFFSALATYLFPLSYIGLGLLAMKRSPWLATLGSAFGLAGALPYGEFVATAAVYKNIAQLPDPASYASLVSGVSSEGAVLLLFLTWIIGHLTGYVLLGIALWRGKLVPRWSSALIIAGVPLQIVAYPLHLGLSQQLGFLLVFFGSIPAALAIVKSIRSQTQILDTQSSSRTESPLRQTG